MRLQREPKELPTVWLYDERGSQLYEEITRLPEYYLPRREREILRARSPEIAARTQARTLVELGAGNASRTRLLLDALAPTLERFVPLDVSEEFLRSTADALAAEYPRLAVDAVRRRLRARSRLAARGRPAADRAAREHDRQLLSRRSGVAS